MTFNQTYTRLEEAALPIIRDSDPIDVADSLLAIAANLAAALSDRRQAVEWMRAYADSVERLEGRR